MDNLTHSLLGLVGAKAGLERLSPGATAMCVLAANAPDADVTAMFGGYWFYLKHHRGITHSLIGTLSLAVLVPLLFWVGDRVLARWRGREPQVRLKGLLLASVLMSASHPVLDWTNNYGVRPWLPWDGSWYYGDLVFIVDPWLWLALGGAAFLLTARRGWRAGAWAALGLVLTLAMLLLPRRSGLPFPIVAQIVWLAGLVGLFFAWRRNVAARCGPKLAAAALAFVVVYWSALALLHARALTHANVVARSGAQQSGETLLRVAALPLPVMPLRWRIVAETEQSFYRFDISALGAPNHAGESWQRAEKFPKPRGADSARAAWAAEDARAQIFLGFSRFPAARVETNCPGLSLVQFADLRFTEPGPARGDGGGGFRVEVAVPHQQPVP